MKTNLYTYFNVSFDKNPTDYIELKNIDIKEFSNSRLLSMIRKIFYINHNNFIKFKLQSYRTGYAVDVDRDFYKIVFKNFNNLPYALYKNSYEKHL